MGKEIPFDQTTLNQVAKICLKMKLPYLRVFGGAVKNLKKAQDIDLAMPFKPKKFSDYSNFVSKLEQIFGKKIDLVFLDEVKNPRLILEILSTSKMLYATKMGEQLFAITLDRLHGIATDELLRYPISEQLKDMKKMSRRLNA